MDQAPNPISLLPYPPPFVKSRSKYEEKYKDYFSEVSYTEDIKGKHFLCFVILSSKYSVHAAAFLSYFFLLYPCLCRWQRP